MSVSVLSLNARGLWLNLKCKALFMFVKQFKTEFCFFQESHSVPEDSKFWRSPWGNDIWFSNCSVCSAGVITLLNRFNGNVLHSEGDSNGHFLIHVISIINIAFLIINIYGYNSNAQNARLLDLIEHRNKHWLTKFPSAHILIGGDFNITLNSQIELWPPGRNSSVTTKIKSLMDRYGLVDTWRQKFPDDPGFTWSTKNLSNYSRIDYWLVSKDLNQKDISISTHPTPLTDHKAILIRINICTLEREIARTSYWKLNRSYLKIEHVKTEIIRLLEYFLKKATVEQSFCKNWKLFKYECAKFL